MTKYDSIQTFIAQVNAQLADNTVQSITASKHRGVLQDVSDTFVLGSIATNDQIRGEGSTNIQIVSAEGFWAFVREFIFGITTTEDLSTVQSELKPGYRNFKELKEKIIAVGTNSFPQGIEVGDTLLLLNGAKIDWKDGNDIDQTIFSVGGKFDLTFAKPLSLGEGALNGSLQRRLLPDATNNEGKYLQVDSTTSAPAWADIGNTGTTIGLGAEIVSRRFSLHADQTDPLYMAVRPGGEIAVLDSRGWVYYYRIEDGSELRSPRNMSAYTPMRGYSAITFKNATQIESILQRESSTLDRIRLVAIPAIHLEVASYNGRNAEDIQWLEYRGKWYLVLFYKVAGSNNKIKLNFHDLTDWDLTSVQFQARMELRRDDSVEHTIEIESIGTNYPRPQGYYIRDNIVWALMRYNISGQSYHYLYAFRLFSGEKLFDLRLIDPTNRSTSTRDITVDDAGYLYYATRGATPEVRTLDMRTVIRMANRGSRDLLAKWHTTGQFGSSSVQGVMFPIKDNDGDTTLTGTDLNLSQLAPYEKIRINIDFSDFTEGADIADYPLIGLTGNEVYIEDIWALTPFTAAEVTTLAGAAIENIREKKLLGIIYSGLLSGTGETTLSRTMKFGRSVSGQILFAIDNFYFTYNLKMEVYGIRA